MYQDSKKVVAIKEYCCFDHSDFLAHSLFAFDVCWGSLGTSIFRNSSSAASNTRSRLPSRLSFRFLWQRINWIFNIIGNLKEMFHVISRPELSPCSLPEVFCKKDFLRNFAKLTGKHLCQGLFYNKVAGLRPPTLLKRDSNTGVFLWIFRNF